MPSKKVYSRVFNLQTLRLLKSSGKTKAELARELGLYQGTAACGKKHSMGGEANRVSTKSE
jgi:hypothetical protein